MLQEYCMTRDGVCITEANTGFWWEKMKGRKRPFRGPECERKYIKMDLNLLKPTSYVMHQHV